MCRAFVDIGGVGFRLVNNAFLKFIEGAYMNNVWPRRGPRSPQPFSSFVPYNVIALQDFPPKSLVLGLDTRPKPFLNRCFPSFFH
jgi:hypothetical protein